MCASVSLFKTKCYTFLNTFLYMVLCSSWANKRKLCKIWKAAVQEVNTLGRSLQLGMWGGNDELLFRYQLLLIFLLSVFILSPQQLFLQTSSGPSLSAEGQLKIHRGMSHREALSPCVHLHESHHHPIPPPRYVLLLRFPYRFQLIHPS